MRGEGGRRLLRSVVGRRREWVGQGDGAGGGGEFRVSLGDGGGHTLCCSPNPLGIRGVGFYMG